MNGDLLYHLIDYLPVFVLVILFGKMVEYLYKISKTAENTIYLMEKMDEIERRLRIIDRKLNK